MKKQRNFKINLQQGYATISLSAIKKILPYLYQGFIYSEAIYLANLHKLLGVKQADAEFNKGFSEIIRGVINDHNLEKQTVNVVNSLISDHLNLNEFRFGMDANYQFDNDDFEDISTKLKDVFGADSWKNKLTDAERKMLLCSLKNITSSFYKNQLLPKKKPCLLSPEGYMIKYSSICKMPIKCRIRTRSFYGIHLNRKHIQMQKKKMELRFLENHAQ